MRLSRDEILELKKVDLQTLTIPEINNFPVTWFKTTSGNYQVISRFDDSEWIYPNTYFPAGENAGDRKIKFQLIPPCFRNEFKKIFWNFASKETPRGKFLVNIFRDANIFFRFLKEFGLESIGDINQIHCSSYVDYLKTYTIKSGRRKGKTLKPKTLEMRFAAVEKLHKHALGTIYEFPEPWPDSSSSQLAGTNFHCGSNRKSSTLIIPDQVWKLIFQAASNRLQDAERLFTLKEKIEQLRKESQEGKISVYYTKLAIKKLLSQEGFNSVHKYYSQYRELRVASVIVILSLSGIRIHELCYLKNNAWYAVDNGNEKLFWMRSISTKTGEGPTEWLIPKLVTKALDVAQKFAAPLQDQLRMQIKCRRDEDVNSIEAFDELAGIDKLFLTKVNKKNSNDYVTTASAKSIRKSLNKFATSNGIEWGFSPHQFRRTFAHYVARSGLGDIRYLREHFKHWSLDMTMLYAANDAQEDELYDEIIAARNYQEVELITHWLDEKTHVSGGTAPAIRRLRNRNDKVRVYESRREMAQKISETIFIRATGSAWCLADDGGCAGRGGVEKTRCSDCSSSVIDGNKAAYWKAVLQQQLQLLDLDDLGPAATQRVKRDIERCKTVLMDLGAREAFEDVDKHRCGNERCS